MSTDAEEIANGEASQEDNSNKYYYETIEREEEQPNQYGVKRRILTKREQALGNINSIRGKGLTVGTKNGKEYPRTLEFGPGAMELTKVVAGLGRGIKKVNGTQTLWGANEWIKKHKPGQNWSAIEDDIIGKEDRPDGVPEVMICDAKGNVRIINGYMLGGSDYGMRKAYYEKYPDIEKQKQVRFSDFKTAMSRISKDLDDEGQFQYAEKLRTVKRHKITAKQVYKQRFFTPTYKEYKQEIKDLEYDPMSKAKLSTNTFNYVYGILFEKPAIVKTFTNVTDKSFERMTPEKYKEYAKDESVKHKIQDALLTIIKDAKKTTQLYLTTAQLITYALIKGSEIQIDIYKEIYGVQVIDLLDFAAMKRKLDSQQVIEAAKQKLTEKQERITKTQEKTAEKRKTEYQNRRKEIEEGEKMWNYNPFSKPDEFYLRTVDGWNLYNGINSERTSKRQSAIQSAAESRTASRAASRIATRQTTAAQSDDEDDEEEEIIEEGTPIDLDSAVNLFNRVNPDLELEKNQHMVDLVGWYLAESVNPNNVTENFVRSKKLREKIINIRATRVRKIVRDVIEKDKDLKKLSQDQKTRLTNRTATFVTAHPSINQEDKEQIEKVMEYLYVKNYPTSTIEKTDLLPEFNEWLSKK